MAVAVVAGVRRMAAVRGRAPLVDRGLAAADSLGGLGLVVEGIDWGSFCFTASSTEYTIYAKDGKCQ